MLICLVLTVLHYFCTCILHALHHIPLSSYVAPLSVRSRVRGAEIGGSSGASSSGELTSLAWIKASPGAFNHDLCLYLNPSFMVSYDCALSYRSCYRIVVALRFTFLFILVNMSLGGISLAHAMLRR
jgi:hypothetical protein